MGEGGPVGMVLRDKSAPSDHGDLGRERRQCRKQTPELLRPAMPTLDEGYEEE